MDLAAWRDLAIFLLALFLMLILLALILFFALFTSFLRKTQKRAGKLLDLALNKTERAEEATKKVSHWLARPLATALSFKEGLKIFLLTLLEHKHS